MERIIPAERISSAAPVLIGAEQFQPLTQSEVDHIAAQKIGCYSRTEVLLALYVLELQEKLAEKEAQI